jgi:hypothetical protein
MKAHSLGPLYAPRKFQCAFYPHAAEGKTATEHEIALLPFCYAESHQSVLFICGKRTNKENGVR